MGWKSSLFSLAVHAGAIAAVGVAVHEERRRAATAIAVRTVEQEKQPEKKAEPPPPKKAPPKSPPKRRTGAPPPPSSAPPPTSNRVLDLGLMITGDAPGGIGIEVPVAPPPPPPPPKAPPVVQSRTGEREGRCAESPNKPTPIEKVRIEYPIEARESGVEGRLVLRAHVGPDGDVVKVEVVQSVGAEIDRAAIEAVMRWKFKPAFACGKGVESSYVIARRFELGD